MFRAHDVELDRIVALKLQRSAFPEHHEEKDRFLREARSAAQLEHPLEAKRKAFHSLPARVRSSLTVRSKGCSTERSCRRKSII